MKYQVIFSKKLKKKKKKEKKIFKTVVCCSHDWCLKGYIIRPHFEKASLPGEANRKSQKLLPFVKLVEIHCGVSICHYLLVKRGISSILSHSLDGTLAHLPHLQENLSIFCPDFQQRMQMTTMGHNSKGIEVVLLEMFIFP